MRTVPSLDPEKACDLARETSMHETVLLCPFKTACLVGSGTGCVCCGFLWLAAPFPCPHCWGPRLDCPCPLPRPRCCGLAFGFPKCGLEDLLLGKAPLPPPLPPAGNAGMSRLANSPSGVSRVPATPKYFVASSSSPAGRYISLEFVQKSRAHTCRYAI